MSPPNCSWVFTLLYNCSRLHANRDNDCLERASVCLADVRMERSVGNSYSRVIIHKKFICTLAEMYSAAFLVKSHRKDRFRRDVCCILFLYLLLYRVMCRARAFVFYCCVIMNVYVNTVKQVRLHVYLTV